MHNQPPLCLSSERLPWGFRVHPQGGAERHRTFFHPVQTLVPMFSGGAVADLQSQGAHLPDQPRGTVHPAASGAAQRFKVPQSSGQHEGFPIAAARAKRPL